MKYARTIPATIALICILLLTSQTFGQPAGNLILQVPDWNQPNPIAYPLDGLPAGGYPQWCSPTAGGNLMGYWEDVNGCTGLTDRQAFNASPGYPGTAATWEQGLYHDGMIEMGWHMDTGTWRTRIPAPIFPPNAGSTNVANILPGLLNYAMSSWTDNDYPVAGSGGTGIVKVGYPNTTGSTQDINMVGAGQITLLQMWQTYCGEIDASRPVEVTFAHWVDTIPGPGPINIPGQGVTAETYPWDPNTDPHSVVGVGYIDLNRGFQGAPLPDEYFVCQDGWQTTGQYVAVPLDSMWVQNDYITNVPEPGTIAILAIGSLAAVIRRRRRHKC